MLIDRIYDRLRKACGPFVMRNAPLCAEPTAHFLAALTLYATP